MPDTAMGRGLTFGIGEWEVVHTWGKLVAFFISMSLWLAILSNASFLDAILWCQVT